jgi:hypothetical protein
MFIEFLGVKSDKGGTTLVPTNGKPDSILIDAFSQFGTRKVMPSEFVGLEQGVIAAMHRTLCKINSHFTYAPSPTKDFYDRIASPRDDTEWARAVEIVIQKLDNHFYQAVRQPITVHFDLEDPFRDHFVARLGLKSLVKGDGLWRP